MDRTKRQRRVPLTLPDGRIEYLALHAITPRERQVLAALAYSPDGSFADHAQRLGIAQNTFRRLVWKARLKLHATDRADLVTRAMLTGLITTFPHSPVWPADERPPGSAPRSHPPDQAGMSLSAVRLACSESSCPGGMRWCIARMVQGVRLPVPC